MSMGKIDALNNVYVSEKHPGIVPNQFLQYERFLNFEGNDTQLLEHQYQGLDWLNVTVTDSNGTVIYLRVATYNATVDLGDTQDSVDVASKGSCFIAANLTAGDSFSMNNFVLGHDEMVKINETIDTQYLGRQIQANLFNISGRSFINENFDGSSVSPVNSTATKYEIMWEQSTGINLKYDQDILTNRTLEDGTFLTAHFVFFVQLIIASPIIPEFSLLLFIPFMMTPALLAIIIYTRRHRT